MIKGVGRHLVTGPHPAQEGWVTRSGEIPQGPPSNDHEMDVEGKEDGVENQSEASETPSALVEIPQYHVDVEEVDTPGEGEGHLDAEAQIRKLTSSLGRLAKHVD